MPDDEALIVERDGAVAILTNNRPPMNRMTFEYMDSLQEMLPRLAADSSVRALVFTAAGDEHFSVGMDLKQVMTHAAERGGFGAVLDQRREVLAMIESMRKPSVATLYGYCLGGGLELPLACHLRIGASEGARIGLPELEIGAMPAWGGSVRLARLVGSGRALDIMLRARKIDGPEALAIGLVTELHPVAQLKQRAVELAHQLASMPASAVAGVLSSVVDGADMMLDAALDLEREAVERCAVSPDQREGMLAFVQKRRPVFNQAQ